MKIVVSRKTDNGTQTIGELTVLDNSKELFKCHTLELAWKENKSKISCIPKGIYVCTKREATRAIPYKHILINNVPSRAGVCIHKGNYYTQIQGCILVGKSIIDINKDGQLDVANSGVAFDELMAIVPNTITLEII